MRRRSHIGLGFTNLLFNALLGFVVMFALAFLLINPIAKSGAIDPKAEFLITLAWANGVDLYVEDPAGNLVWFRSREAGLMHLDRAARQHRQKGGIDAVFGAHLCCSSSECLTVSPSCRPHDRPYVSLRSECSVGIRRRRR
jgi:hypothetical protein